LLLTGTLIMPSSAESQMLEPRAMLKLVPPTTPNHVMIYFSENQVNFRSFTSASNETGEQLLCTESTDTKCAPTLASKWTRFGADSSVGNCAIAPESICVRSFDLVANDGTVSAGVPTERVHKHDGGVASTYDGRTNLGFAGGSSPWTWTIGTGDSAIEYLVIGVLGQSMMVRNGSWDVADKNLRFAIFPVKRVLGERYKEFATEDGCVATDDGVCYVRQPFAKNLRFKVALRLPISMSGWLNGRLRQPSAYIDSYNANYSDLVVEAAPTEEIVAGGWVPIDANADAVMKRWGFYQSAAITNNNYDVPSINPDDVEAVNTFNTFSSVLGDKALSNYLAWRLNTSSHVDAAPMPAPGPNPTPMPVPMTNCNTGKGIQGIVATNAAVYDPGAPTFDQSTSTLNYRVAAPHLASDGTDNLGTYGFSMRADLIKCYYGISTLPTSASVSITYGTGSEPKISTVDLKVTRDWVYLNASNFTYSSPTLKVKLTAPPAPVPVVTPAPVAPAPVVAPAQVVAKPVLKSITCMKGKTKKVVKAVSPKCPMGYKKVA
ncbi:MAG: hypothetical protein NT174_04000, partial [Actinobacteria bacterium]|nr:hypothetical protein [Actinomycetota bacterium]